MVCVQSSPNCTPSLIISWGKKLAMYPGVSAIFKGGNGGDSVKL